MLNGELYVGHDVPTLDPNRTFESLYVTPLVQLLDQRNNVSFSTNTQPNGVFESNTYRTFVLLIDFKQSDEHVFDEVWKQLQPLRVKNYLSYWDGNKFMSGPVTIALSGNAPFDRIAEVSSHRDVFYDAPLQRLPGLVQYSSAMASTIHPSIFNISNSYYASTNFRQSVGFVWHGHLSPSQMSIIRGQIECANILGLKSRYWGTPAWPISLRNHIWHVLVKEGADVLNVDDLRAAAAMNWQTAFHGW